MVGVRSAENSLLFAPSGNKSSDIFDARLKPSVKQYNAGTLISSKETWNIVSGWSKVICTSTP